MATQISPLAGKPVPLSLLVDVGKLVMTVFNELDRFHLVMAALERLPQMAERGASLTRLLKGKLIEHKHYIDRHGRDMPEIRDWTWSSEHG
jgi:phosphoketolase